MRKTVTPQYGAWINEARHDVVTRHCGTTFLRLPSVIYLSNIVKRKLIIHYIIFVLVVKKVLFSIFTESLNTALRNMVPLAVHRFPGPGTTAW